MMLKLEVTECGGGGAGQSVGVFDPEPRIARASQPPGPVNTVITGIDWN